MREVRMFTRVPYQVVAEINSQDTVLRGETTDLCLNGLYMKSAQKLEVNALAELTIPPDNIAVNNPITIKGVVVRLDDEGMGFKFHQVDVDAFIILKNIVSYYCGNEHKVMDEFYANISQKERLGN